MPKLKQSPTLADFQKYVRQLEEERGFTGVSLQQNCLMLGEEVGELFKAVRKIQNMPIDKNSKVGTVEEELADVLIFLCSIANQLDIDFEQAFRDKEVINHKRVWQRTDTAGQ